MNSLLKKGTRSLESGGVCAFAFHFLFGTTILLGLLLTTVHNRPQFNLDGLSDFSLPGLHNQLLPLISSAFLGFLSMRLALKVAVRPIHSFILGMGTQMTYQTFPNNLWFYWKTYPSAWWILFMAAFLTLEGNQLNQRQKKFSYSLLSTSLLTGMIWVDWMAALIFITFYGVIFARVNPSTFDWATFFKFIKPPMILGGVALLGGGVFIYAGIYSPREISSELFLHAYCEDGIRGLLHKSFPPQLPSWTTLIVLGTMASISVLFFAKQINKQYFHLAIIISGVATYIFSKILFQSIFHEQGIYDIYLAFPLFLALFTLLPIWLETWIGHTGIFVLASIVLAFCTTFVQLRNYSVLFPVVGPKFYSACLSGPFYH